MTNEQREVLFFSIIILKGGADMDKLSKLSDDELFSLLLDETGKTMESFWNLVDENEKLKKEYYPFTI